MYVISSGKSVISELSKNSFKVTNNADKAITFNTIGEAMIEAIKVNNLIGAYSYRVINKN